MRGIAALPQSAEPRLVEMPEPDAPGPGQVLCRTLELGICGTDREILESLRPMVPPGEPHLVLGHECLARIEATGPDVERLQTGDLVVPLVRRAIADTPIRVDMLAFGQYTERGIVTEHGFSTPYWLDQPQYLLRVDDALRPWAVLAEPFSVAEKGINEALLLQSARLGDSGWGQQSPRVLVTGMGPIGFAAAAVARCRGWDVTLYGRDPRDSFRAELATRLGATYLGAAQGETSGLEHEAADPSEPDSEQDRFDLILECTGSDQVMAQWARSLAARGVMVWLGSSRRPEPAMHNLAQLMREGVLRNHLHVGCVNAAPRDFRAALEHLAQLSKQDSSLLDALITDRVSQSDSLWHYEQRRPQGIKAVVMFD
jgi:threonine dehydrogenase-like Zn-dependent dehydrogenase